MLSKESRFVDKSKWQMGPWMSEPDELLFRHRGLRCAIRRDRQDGSWRGYVEIPYGNPHRERDLPIKVHGDAIVLGHQYLDGADHVFAFDCGHIRDFQPAPGQRNGVGPEEYRTCEYAESECRKLADQVASATRFRVFVKDMVQALRRLCRLPCGDARS